MTDNEIIDLVLQYLYDHTHHTAGTQVKLEIFKAHDIVCDKQQYERVFLKIISSGIADKRESMVGNDDSLIITKLGIDIIENHSSYSSFLIAQKKATSMTTTKTVIAIGTPIFFGFTTLFFAWQNWLDKKELNKKEAQIESQQQHLDKQQTTIDSLQIILARPDTTLKQNK